VPGKGWIALSCIYMIMHISRESSALLDPSPGNRKAAEVAPEQLAMGT
jgi:hypothetical protein